MECRRVRKELSVYLDGEMPAAERARVAHHLRQCAGCAAEAEALRRTIHLARSLGALSPPPNLRARLHTAVLASLAEPPAPAPRL
ncbi:MAG: zf-HC2 domain-containing protein, partial [Armatimonadota bacterium]|nr:zf-HC2 domain-containing protein [Armatimonadota bacterium]